MLHALKNMKKRTFLAPSCPRRLVQQEQPVCVEPGEVEVQGADGDGLQRNEVEMNLGPDEPFCGERALSQCRGMLFCYFSISQAAEMLYSCRMATTFPLGVNSKALGQGA